VQNVVELLRVGQAWHAVSHRRVLIVFCSAVNARFMMVRPNKTKPEGYMWPLDVPGMAPDVRIEYRITETGLE
jgi:hypothetical protein